MEQEEIANVESDCVDHQTLQASQSNTEPSKKEIEKAIENIKNELEYNNQLLNIILNTINNFKDFYWRTCNLTKSLNKILVEERKEKDNINSTKDINKTAPGELIITDELVAEFPEIHNLHKNATALNDLLANKVSLTFWKDIFEEEITKLFDANEKKYILLNVNSIITKETTDKELLYKDLYDTIIVLNAHSKNYKSLYDNFIGHLQERYVDHWDWVEKLHREEYDIHYYHIYRECRKKIKGYIDYKFSSEPEEQKDLYTNTFNKYLSFLYILYNEIDQEKWEYNEKDVTEDKQEILNLKANIENIECISFCNKKPLATLRSKKLIRLISKNFITYVSKKIVFEPENIQNAKEVEYKIQIYKTIKNKDKFVSALVKASYSALIELGFKTEKKHGIRELIYSIINTLIPDLLLTPLNIKEKFNGETLCDFDKSAHIKSIARSLIKETFCLKYDDCNGTTLCKNFKPELTYTDINGAQKIITSISDLF